MYTMLKTIYFMTFKAYFPFISDASLCPSFTIIFLRIFLFICIGIYTYFRVFYVNSEVWDKTFPDLLKIIVSVCGRLKILYIVFFAPCQYFVRMTYGTASPLILFYGTEYSL